MNNKNTYIIWGAVIILMVAGFIWFSRRTYDNQTPKAALTGQSGLIAAENSFDFGKISMAAGKVNRDFRVKNSGTKAVNITKIYTSCMCTEATLRLSSGKELGPYGMPGHGGFAPKINQPVAPGEEVMIKTTFDPTAHGPAGVGLIEREVYIENDSGEPLIFQFQATVTP